MVNSIISIAVVILGGFIAVMVSVKLLGLLWALLSDVAGIIFSIIVLIIISLIVMAIV